jgi:hypothetical protein
MRNLRVLGGRVNKTTVRMEVDGLGRYSHDDLLVNSDGRSIRYCDGTQ